MNELLSIVVPCYNEEPVIPETIRRLQRVKETLEGFALRVELIFVDDGSRDLTSEIIKGHIEADGSIRLISFSRNFGHQIAVTAGIDEATGDAVVLIDADLQDPPEVIEQMVAKWREGYDVVYGTRTQRAGESAFKLATARGFYRILNRLSEIPIPLDTGDFRLIGRPVVDAIKNMRERDRFVRGMVSWAGFRQIAMPYERAQRFAGESKYPLRKMLRFATDGILSFSIKPLRASIMLGSASACVALLVAIYAVVMRLFTNQWVPGWTAIMVAILFLGGAQLLCLGIAGEYIGRIYGEVKQRPLYLVREYSGFPSRRAERPQSQMADQR